MYGLKNVRARHSDALSRVSWDRFEHLLADYYRQQGYEVQHSGTGGTGRTFDGGIDLRLHRGDERILVQCKHWNAKQVPHNDVHQLLGLMVNEGATGAILVTSGEFTAAALQAANKLGHVQLIDGTALRAMIGPVPEPVVVPAVSSAAADRAAAMAGHVGERLLSAAEDRIRYGGGGRRRNRGRGAARTTVQDALVMLGLKVVVFILFVLFVMYVARTAGNAALRAVAPKPQVAAPVTSPSALAPANVSPRNREVVDWYTGTTIEDAPPGYVPPPPPSAAEIRESQRKADEAMKVIEHSTPEL